jgi:hypothetical protein
MLDLIEWPPSASVAAERQHLGSLRWALPCPWPQHEGQGFNFFSAVLK